MPKTISAIIIVKNEESMLEACLSGLTWCDEIIVLDSGSTDDSKLIAQKYKAKIVEFSHQSFAKLREKAAQEASKDFLFYVDADERVTPSLAREILDSLAKEPNSALRMKRKNICYGQKLNLGGWENDYVTRVFAKDDLKGWQGEIHESPIFSQPIKSLKNPLIHLTHRSTKDNLLKSAAWTEKEAQLLAEAGIKKVTFFTLMRKGVMEFIRRAVFKKAYKDGMAGLVEALVQAINRIFVYIQVWELQQKPSIKEKYQQQEDKIKKLWAEEKKQLK